MDRHGIYFISKFPTAWEPYMLAKVEVPSLHVIHHEMNFEIIF